MPEKFTLTLRKVTADDDALLYEIFASSQTEKMQIAGFDKKMIDQLLRQQHNARESQYAANYPSDRNCLVLVDEKVAGRLYLYETGQSILIVDIALLTHFRGKGIGSRLIRDLQREAGENDKAIELQVEMGNPAQNLYGLLGFTVTAQQTPYIHMTWQDHAKD